MKGFILLEVVKFLNRQYGDTFSADLILSIKASMKPSINGAYSPIDDYLDKALDYLITNAATLRKMPKAELSKIIGAYFFSELSKFNKSWVRCNTNTFDLLKTHDMAFNELTRIHLPGFIPLEFSYTEISPDRLDLNYRSNFISGDVAEGLIAAMFVHYGEKFSIERRCLRAAVDHAEKFILRIKSNSN